MAFHGDLIRRFRKAIAVDCRRLPSLFQIVLASPQIAKQQPQTDANHLVATQQPAATHRPQGIWQPSSSHLAIIWGYLGEVCHKFLDKPLIAIAIIRERPLALTVLTRKATEPMPQSRPTP